MEKLIYLSLLLTLFSCTKEKLSDYVAVKSTNEILTQQTWMVNYSSYNGIEMKDGNLVNFFVDGKLNSYTPLTTYSLDQTWSLNNNIITFSNTGWYNTGYNNPCFSWTITVKSENEIWFVSTCNPSSFGNEFHLRKN